jgi:FkbM family methyltransferase
MARAIGIAAERNRVRDQIEVVQTVLDLREGTASFVEQVDPLTSAVWMGHASQPAGHVRTVSQRTLDGWVGSSGIQRVDFVKIDAEGSDLAILQGGTETLRRFRPAIAVTTYHAADHCNRLVQLLDRLNLGYRWRAKGMISYEGVPRPVMLHAVARR